MLGSGLAVVDGFAVADGDAVGEPVGEGDVVGEPVGDGEVLGEPVGDADVVGVPVGDALGTDVEGLCDVLPEGEALVVGSVDTRSLYQWCVVKIRMFPVVTVSVPVLLGFW
ncbi:hypothetical protein [Nonomuraea jiangxiensis]|nr:hypothetical protein [Nonomuraea jiangxiensis]